MRVLSSTALVVCSFTLTLGGAEVALRVKNSAMTSYDIEMWRYSNELKEKSDDPHLDFDHVRSRAAVLQNVMIRINAQGLRGPALEPLPPGGRRVLFLGGSIALGWGVAEEDTVESRLQRMLIEAGQPAQVLNAGVGNYNADRYVSRFFKELTALDPTDIVVLYFLRDAEELPPGGGNALLRHSELAVTLWIAYHRLYDRAGEQALVDHYRNAYRPGAPGFLVMQSKLRELAEYANTHHIRLYLAMMPDVHNLVDYPLSFVHETMRTAAERAGYRYVDLLPALRGRPPAELFAMPGDPHPSAFAHERMADAIFTVLSNGVDAPTAP
jgi:hypothetical protein